MLNKLKDIKEKYDAINDKLTLPETVSNQNEYKRLMKEYKELTPIVDKYNEYLTAKASFDDAEKMLSTPLDKETKDWIEEEYFSEKEHMAQVIEELKVLLLPKDENDDKSAIVEIRAGVGGEESTLFANSLFRMYSMYAESHNYRIEIINANETELGGYNRITFLVEGNGVFSRLKFESGTHRVQRVPETESQGRIQTSAVTVAVLPEVEDVEVDINPADLQIDVFRASGAGGQHINKTSSAIRMTHIPTGIVVECQNERSQHQNKEMALKMLRSRLYNMYKKEQDDKISAERKDQVGSGDRSERIRTYNFPQGRVTDHRINLTLYKLENFMNGDLDEMLNALIANAQAEKLKA